VKESRVRRRTDDRGAALVEFALVMPLLMALILGMVSFGIVFNQEMQLTHAAREGARYGAAIPVDQAFTSGTWGTNVRDIIIARSDNELGGAGTTVCVALVEGSSGNGTYPLTVVSTGTRPTSYFSTTGGTPCITDETYPVGPDDPGRRVQVVVTRPGEIETLFYSWTVTLETEATAKAEVDQ
jgi:Flp pilus assembly protein TadG